jgi:ribosome recycling factor
MTQHYEKDFETCIHWLQTELRSVSAGRVHPQMLDTLRVSVYGTETPLTSIASVTIEDPRTLRVSPWDKSQVKSIETAIRDNGMPYSTVTDSDGLRVIVPQMTEETRKKILKVVGQLHEEARVRIRSVRQSANDAIDKSEKSKEINQDEQKKYKSDIQKMVDDANKKLDELYNVKESDIMTI